MVQAWNDEAWMKGKAPPRTSLLSATATLLCHPMQQLDIHGGVGGREALPHQRTLSETGRIRAILKLPSLVNISPGFLLGG
jgi:hypothetical protein